MRDAKPELSPGLETIIARALEKDRNLRFGSAGELHSALDRHFASNGKVVKPADVAAYVSELCAVMKAEGPKLDTRKELWTRESAEGGKQRAAMQDALSVELDRAAEDIESGQSKKSWLVKALIAVVVLGLLALVVSSALRGG